MHNLPIFGQGLNKLAPGRIKAGDIWLVSEGQVRSSVCTVYINQQFKVVIYDQVLS